MNDLSNKRKFLYEGSVLYHRMTCYAESDVIRRFLAFRIIVNSVTFSDLVRDGQLRRFRKLRDAFLAHKQNDDFFDAFEVAQEISFSTIHFALSFMEKRLDAGEEVLTTPEISCRQNEVVQKLVMKKIFKDYEKRYLEGFRVFTNFLCHTGTAVHQIGNGDLAGVFYRYHASLALFKLARDIYQNVPASPEFYTTILHAKLDMIMHAQNLAECVFRDPTNKYAISGLKEVMIDSEIGDVSPLNQLWERWSLIPRFRQLKGIRNRLIAHVDEEENLADLICKLEDFPISVIYQFVDQLDYGVYQAARSDFAIWSQYLMDGHEMKGNIVDIPGYYPGKYF